MSALRISETFSEEHNVLQLIIAGHGHSAEAIDQELTDYGMDYDGLPAVTEEHYWRLSNRYKWCERLTGWGCDQEGEWHRHWMPVSPNPVDAITLAWWPRGGL